MKSIFGMLDGEDNRVRNSIDELREDDDRDFIGDDRHEGLENNTLQLHEEELDVTKNRVQSGEVVLSKDIIEEKKTIDVPVINEEIVIERRAINNEISDRPITSEETIRIPVSHEDVEVNKHTVLVGEVSAHKREVENVHHVEETVKREEARVSSTGDVDVIDEGINSIH